MALAPGTHRLGPDSGTMQVRTFREGVAQRAGHDLILGVGHWEATVEIGQDGVPAMVGLEADPASLQVQEGLRGVKPLTDKDRAEIHRNIHEQVLRGHPIAFRSNEVRTGDGRLSVRGELALAGTTRPASFDVDLGADARLRATLTVAQSEWGIKPYRAFMGALKVRDTVDVVLDVGLPSR